MLAHLPKINLAVALVVLGCFFLPWISIDCNNAAVVRLSGFQLATGKVEPDRTVLKQIGKEMGSDVKSLKDLDRDHQAGARIHFFVVVVCGLGMLYYGIRMWGGRNRVQLMAESAMAGAGVLFLLVLGLSDFGLTVPPETALVLDTTYQIGYYLTFLAFLTGLGVNLFGLLRYTDPPKVSAAMPLPPAFTSETQGAAQFMMQPGSDMLANVFQEPVPYEEVKPQQPEKPEVPWTGKTCPKCGAPAGEFQVQCMKCGSRIKPGKA